MSAEQKYWFPAKRYGWGWGPPSCWQGWLVLAIYFGLLGMDVLVFPPDRELHLFLVFVACLSALLVGICWVKGEPPRWRWDNE